MEKLTVLREGEVIDYQTVIEEVIGDWISKLKCYDGNWDCKKIIGGIEVVDSERAYFVPDADYELSIVKKRRQF